MGENRIQADPDVEEALQFPGQPKGVGGPNQVKAGVLGLDGEPGARVPPRAHASIILSGPKAKAEGLRAGGIGHHGIREGRAVGVPRHGPHLQMPETPQVLRARLLVVVVDRTAARTEQRNGSQ